VNFTLSDALSRLPPGFSEFRPGSSAAAITVVVLQQNRLSFFFFFFFSLPLIRVRSSLPRGAAAPG
jgi:hypothetical protein